MSKPQVKREAKRAIFHIGIELMGSVNSWAANKRTTGYATELGLEVTNQEGRTVVVPWSNIRCCELKAEKVDASN